MPIIEIQHVPGQAKEKVLLPAGASFFEWLIKRDFFNDIVIVVNGAELADDAELDFQLTELHCIQIFSQPKNVIGKVLSPVFKLVQKVFGFLIGLAPIFPYTFYHLTHYWFAAADIP
ncbi:hypothetical protein QVM89_24000, partial [Serratia marcescens]|nr:hypothetical protein [Serratia marcescens]